MAVTAQPERPEFVVGVAVGSKLGRSFCDTKLRVDERVGCVLGLGSCFGLFFL
jgi:hypothetical protein